MKIAFLGAGSAFTTQEHYQSNMLLASASGKSLLIDCGTDIRHSLTEHGVHAALAGSKIDAIYISHCHSDHIGGLEFLALTSYFSDYRRSIRLFAEENLMQKMWDESLKGGLAQIQGRLMQLDDYFICSPVRHNGSFKWEEICFTLVEMPHIICNENIIFSYGLLIDENADGNGTAFITTDTQFCPDKISGIAQKVPVIFHDCETAPCKSGVHAHYDELCSLPTPVKNKMWLYHYQPEPAYDPEIDGFRGFVRKGQEFCLDDLPGL